MHGICYDLLLFPGIPLMVYRVCGLIVWLATRRDVNRAIALYVETEAQEIDEQMKGRGQDFNLKYRNARYN